MIGRTQFYGRDDEFTHSVKYGPGLVTGLFYQWQNGEQVPIWPASVAKGTLKFPPFIKLAATPAK